MTAATAWQPGYPLWLTRRARWFLFAMHAPFIAECPVWTIDGLAGGASGNPVLVVLLGLAMGVLQLRHSFAAARGQRPAGWQWTFVALSVVVYLPMYWFTWNWAATQILLITSAAMLLRGWFRVAAIVAPILGTAVTAVVVLLAAHLMPAVIVVAGISWLVDFLMYSAALYAAIRLVMVADELYAARTQQAEGAVGQERLRVSRDLHDLLGQSLSAISLKGDLALRLLPFDPARAGSEIESLTGVARSALHDVIAVARDEHRVSLHGEIDAAAALLSAAGIEVRIDTGLCVPPEHAREVLAWAVREATTNVLRHSEARTCSITLRSGDGGVWLEVRNDGARAASGQGSGLVGLAVRAEAVSGSVRAGTVGDGMFLLRIWVPKEVT
jgi:two-component system, NarL family, sensor histidine kinase DesK